MRPASLRSRLYDVFVFWHHQSIMFLTPPGQTDRNAARSGPAFLPWHRYFLITREEFLRQAVNEANFRIPYWDWNTDADLPNPSTSAIWDINNLGQFVGANWRVRLAMNAATGNLQSVNRSLQRNLGANGALPTREQVRITVREQPVYDQTPPSIHPPPVEHATTSRVGLDLPASTTMCMCGLAETCSCHAA
jgi:tyrosinase